MTFSTSLGHFQTHIMCWETTIKWMKQTKFKKNKQEPQIKQNERKPKQPQKETRDLCLQYIFLLEDETLKANSVRIFWKMKNMLQAWFWSCTYKATQECLKLTWKETSLFSSLFFYQMKRMLYCTGCLSWWGTEV